MLAAETLIEQLRRIAPALSSPMPADVAAAIGEVQHIYPEIWANLDRARSMVSKDVPQYDDLRARQPAALMGVTSIKTADPIEQAAIFAVAGAAVASIGAKSAVMNRAGVLDAEAALEILRAAIARLPARIHAAITPTLAKERGRCSGYDRHACPMNLHLACRNAIIRCCFRDFDYEAVQHTDEGLSVIGQ